mmetsp:Transcript_38375/g.110925  ORF Transcript_38375/g.110925 Transcript_38375/m.110925 type:complete len:239 (-) Transcript_38375:42-758(-)
MLFEWAHRRASNGWVAFGHFWLLLACLRGLQLLGDRIWDGAHDAGVTVLPVRSVPWAMLLDSPWGAYCWDNTPCNASHCSPEGVNIFPRHRCMGLYNYTKCMVIARELDKAHQSSDEAMRWNVYARLYDLICAQNVAFISISYFWLWLVKDITGCGPKSWTFRFMVVALVAAYVGDLCENVPLLYASLYPHSDWIYAWTCMAYPVKAFGFMQTTQLAPFLAVLARGWHWCRSCRRKRA